MPLSQSLHRLLCLQCVSHKLFFSPVLVGRQLPNTDALSTPTLSTMIERYRCGFWGFILSIWARFLLSCLLLLKLKSWAEFLLSSRRIKNEGEAHDDFQSFLVFVDIQWTVTIFLFNPQKAKFDQWSKKYLLSDYDSNEHNNYLSLFAGFFLTRPS